MVLNHKNNIETVHKYHIIKTNLFPFSYHSLVQNFNGIDFILCLVLGKKNLLGNMMKLELCSTWKL